MLAPQRKDLSLGITLMASFILILASLFMPIFKGVTPMNFMDRLYNSISKGSVYYIDQLQSETVNYRGKSFDFSWQAETPARADRMAAMFKNAGANVTVSQMLVTVNGDLGLILDRILADSDFMFNNQGETVRDRYQLDEKTVLYEWWTALKGVNKQLNRQKRFQEAKFVNAVLTKAVECSYNYYGIGARNIMEQATLVVLSLVFYVIYTVWLGYAILFLLKGFGLKLEQH